MLTAFSMSFRLFFVPRFTKFTTVDSARDIRETEETAARFPGLLLVGFKMF